MDSRMIDVAIGLALVFAIASLLATAAQQLWHSARGTRGRIQRQVVHSFVGDDPAFARVLMDQSLLVSLSREARQDAARRPSWINADLMVAALVGHLTERHAGGVRPTTPADWLAAVRLASERTGPTPNGQAPNAEFVRALSSLIQGVEHDWPAYEKRLCAWYDAVGERSQGWFKRWTQTSLMVIGLLMGAALNINPIVIGERLWQDESLRSAMVSAAQDASRVYAETVAGAASAASAAAAAGSAPAAAAAPAALLPGPVRLPQTEAVERAIAGLREALLQAAESTRDHSPQNGTWQTSQQALQAVLDLRPQLDRRRLPDDGSTLALRRRVDADQAIATHLLAIERALPAGAPHADPARQHAQLMMAVGDEQRALDRRTQRRQADCGRHDDPALRTLCLRLNDLSSLQAAGLPIGWSWATFPRIVDDGCRAFDVDGVPLPPDCRGWALLGNGAVWLNFGMALCGWLLLAIGCTLGAPFWFDLLAQLVKLRGGRDAAGGGGAAAGTAPPPSLLTRTEEKPAPAPSGEAMDDALNDAERALSADERRRVQRALGLGDAEAGGVFDARTRERIRSWQTEQGHAATGELTAAQIQQLLSNPSGDDDGYIG